jgi:polysaccharide pyruvyl transferase WcaK-like protein
MKKREKTKVLISGWYGHGNIGDELILKSMINVFKRKIYNVEIRILSDNPIYTKCTHNIVSTYQLPLKFKGYIRMLLNGQTPFKTIKFIKNTDIFVMGGGGFLSDWQSYVPWGWLKQIILAKILGKRTMIYAIGAGPFSTKKGKMIVKHIINNYVDMITVRDKTSKKELLACGVEEKKIIVTADPVVNYLEFKKNNYKKHKIDNIVKNYNNDFFNVGITVASLFHSNKWENNPEKYFDEYIKNLTIALKKIAKNYNDVKFYFIPFMMTEEDISFSNKLNGLIGNKGLVVKSKNDIERIITIYKDLDCVIAMRYHANILATILDKPVIPLVYHHKVADYIKRIGLREKILDLGNGENWKDNIFNFNELVSQFDDIYNDRYSITSVKKEICKLKVVEEVNVNKLKGLIKR